MTETEHNEEQMAWKHDDDSATESSQHHPADTTVEPSLEEIIEVPTDDEVQSAWELANAEALLSGLPSSAPLTQKRSVQLTRDLGWLKRVSGVDDTQIAQWSDEEWSQWSQAMHTDSNEPNPCVPQWMRHLIQGRWWWDFSLPFPHVGQLLPTNHDWFEKAETHSDFELRVVEPGEGVAPTLGALKNAWTFATGAGGTPLVNMTLEPTSEPGSLKVIGAIEAFYVIMPSNNAGYFFTEYMSRLIEMIGSTGPFNGPARDTSKLLSNAGLSPESDHLIALGWEWIY